MEIEYTGKKLTKQKTKAKALKVYTDYTNYGATEAAKMNGISRNWLYILIRKLKGGDL